MSQFNYPIFKKHLQRHTNPPIEALLVYHETEKQLLQRLDTIHIEPKRILTLQLRNQPAPDLASRFPQANIQSIDLLSDLSAHTLIEANATHSVDLVISNLCLYWLDDCKSCFKAIHHWLNPDGLFLFTTLGPDTLQELRYSWAQVDEHPHVQSFIDLHDIGDQLLAANFKDPVMDMDKLYLTYQNTLDIIHDIHDRGESLCHPNRQKGLTGRNKFTQMLQHYEQFRGNDGKVSATYEVIHGHAWGNISKPNTGLNDQGEARIAISEIGRRNK